MSVDFTGITNLDMDRIFDSVNIAANTGRDVYNALNNGFNQFNNYPDPTSRRNGGYSPQQPGYQPVSYGYGYEESTVNPYGFGRTYPSYYGNTQNQNHNNGYYGFWNPMYGKGGY